MRSQKFDLARLIAGVLTRIVFPVYRWWYFRNDRRQAKLIQAQTAKLRKLNASVTDPASESAKVRVSNYTNPIFMQKAAIYNNWHTTSTGSG